jgi:hypothetical protein
MKVLFILLASGFILASCSSGPSGADKFLGKWKEVGSHPKTTIITEGGGNTYDILIPKRPEIKNDGIQQYTDFKYDAGQDILYKGSGHEMEIKYNKDSGTIQAFVNHMPASDPMKRINE